MCLCCVYAGVCIHACVSWLKCLCGVYAGVCIHACVSWLKCLCGVYAGVCIHACSVSWLELRSLVLLLTVLLGRKQ